MRQVDRKDAAQKLLDAIGQLPEDMVAEAGDIEAFQKRNKSRKHRYAARIFGSAAVLAAAVLAVVVWRGGILSGGMGEKDVKYDNAQMENSGVQKQGNADSQESAAEGDAELINIWNLQEQKDRDTENDSKPESKQSKSIDMENSEAQESQYNQDAARQEESPGQKLDRGKVYPAAVDIQGKGKDKYVRFTLQLGSDGEGLRYRLEASRLSLEISESPEDAKQGGQHGNKKESVTCSAGTQVVCSFQPSSPAVPGKEPALPEWQEKGIESVARITVTAEDSLSEKSEGTIVLGCSSGKYYMVFI